jgi:hypothetical protein
MRSKSSNQPFQEDLEDGRSDKGIEETNDSIVYVPEAANANLANEDYGDRDQRTKEGSLPNGNDFGSKRVGELGVDDLAVLKVDRKGTGGGGVSFVYLLFVNLDGSLA